MTLPSDFSPPVREQPAIKEQAAFECRDLRFSYADKTVLQIGYWRVARGERIFLRGASGSGKSTLLSLLCGMLVPSAGELRVLDCDLTVMSGYARDRFRACHMGVVFQQFNLIPWLSVRDNIRLAAHFADAKSAQKEHMVELAEQLNLPGALLDRKAAELSIGQQQRVAVMRALINRPEILLVDEPTSALDQDNRDAFIQVLLTTLDRCGATLLFVSHDQTLASHFPQQLSMAELNPMAELNRAGGAQ
jgi:putative ABC transport system ATP-binding protein